MEEAPVNLDLVRHLEYFAIKPIVDWDDVGQRICK